MVERGFENTYPLSVGVVEGFELDNVGVSDDTHDLQLAVLQTVRSGTCMKPGPRLIP